MANELRIVHTWKHHGLTWCLGEDGRVYSPGVIDRAPFEISEAQSRQAMEALGTEAVRIIGLLPPGALRATKE
jgi:hypothetical protein